MNTCDLLYLNPLAFFNYNFQVNGKEIQYFGSIQRGNKKRLLANMYFRIYFLSLVKCFTYFSLTLKQ